MNVNSSVIVNAPAKINLFLHVVGRRDDGYHLLDSLVVFAEYGDLVEVRKACGISLEIVGKYADVLTTSKSENNLVWKAAEALQKYIKDNQGIHIRLTKNLPIGSGIGGGSADAAATIKAIQKLWNLDIPAEELFEIALSLGSDVPVCLYGKPALMRGIGDKLIAVKLDELAYMVLVNPNIGLATVDVFRDFSDEQILWSVMNEVTENSCYNLSEITDTMGYTNDLEVVSIKKLPIIGDIMMTMRDTKGCFLARMSGSGATCFALYHAEVEARMAAEKLKEIYPQAWCEVTRIASDGNVIE